MTQISQQQKAAIALEELRQIGETIARLRQPLYGAVIQTVAGEILKRGSRNAECGAMGN